jgi:hypothetical protein
MSIKVTGWDGNPFDQNSIESNAGRFIVTHCRFVLSGSYTSNGDTLDFTNGGVNSAVPPAQNRGIASIQVQGNGPAGSIGANGGNYTPIPGSNLTNWLLKIFATAGSQYSAGAYSTDATSDIIAATIVWAR